MTIVFFYKQSNSILSHDPSDLNLPFYTSKNIVPFICLQIKIRTHRTHSNAIQYKAIQYDSFNAV